MGLLNPTIQSSYRRFIKRHSHTYNFAPYIYDLVLLALSLLIQIFYKELRTRGASNIPDKGPVIFAVGPHANRVSSLFYAQRTNLQKLTDIKELDAMILMRAIRLETGYRAAVLMRKSNLRRKFVGLMARCLGTIPVDLAWDKARRGSGTIYLPDYEQNPFLVRGVGTHFDSEAEVGGLVIVPAIRGAVAAREIAQIRGPEELVLKNCFDQNQCLRHLNLNTDARNAKLGGRGAVFTLAPKPDHTELQDAVLEKLDGGGFICLFPEGASHDAPKLLPLKCRHLFC
jgi:glycerol-3-phosphate O-acyltransferase / dihydroxyacetone phosphate acyltransferase